MASDRDVVALIMGSKAVLLRVHLPDGSQQEVVVPNTGRRHRKLEAIIESLEWDRIEPLDKDKKLLGPAITNDEAEQDIEYDDVDGVGIANVIRSVLQDAQKTNLEVMRTTMRETARIFEAQTKSQADLVSMMGQAVHAIQDSYTVAMRVQTAQAVAGASDGSSPEVMEMMKMALMMGSMQKPAPPQRPQPQTQPKPIINIPNKEQSK